MWAGGKLVEFFVRTIRSMEVFRVGSLYLMLFVRSLLNGNFRF